MEPMDRRTFLSGLTSSLVTASAISLPALRASAAQYPPTAAQQAPASAAAGCWLDVCAPFVVEDPALNLSTEILLTAACFPGVEGFRDPQYTTEYQILLFDPRGREIPIGQSSRLVIPAMHPTVVNMGEVAGRKKFWGSAKVRLVPRGEQTTRAGDLFSAGFVRWKTPESMDNVHAHPAAASTLHGRFNYSMPFPPLYEYHCAFILFNPNDTESYGVVRVVDRMGQTVGQRAYKLRPRHTLAYSVADLKTADSPGEALTVGSTPAGKLRQGGVIVVTNDSEAVSFANTMIKGRRGATFSVEHPLHFQDSTVKPARESPYGPNRSFPAEALLYTPMLFSGRQFGGLELETRLYMSSSRWREEALWLMPFVTDERGMIVWVSNRDDQFPARVLPTEVSSQGLLRLTEFQSCRIDARGLPLPAGFSGGYGVATIPPTSHSLMKVEVRAANWDRVAFTHFRPGGHFHRRYREVTERGGVATDYIISGCQVRGSKENRQYDCLLALMNIEFEDERTGTPKLQLFGSSGLVAEKSLGEFPPLACRHFLVSELFPGLQTEPGHPLTIRMLDSNTMVVASALHIDYRRRDIALEHGSDRHSTYFDYKC